MLSSVFHTHFYENGYSTVFLDYKFCFFNPKRAAISKETYIKQSRSSTLGLMTNEKRQVSLYCAFYSNHAASFSFTLNI